MPRHAYVHGSFGLRLLLLAGAIASGSACSGTKEDRRTSDPAERPERADVEATTEVAPGASLADLGAGLGREAASLGVANQKLGALLATAKLEDQGSYLTGTSVEDQIAQAQTSISHQAVAVGNATQALAEFRRNAIVCTATPALDRALADVKALSVSLTGKNNDAKSKTTSGATDLSAQKSCTMARWRSGPLRAPSSLVSTVLRRRR